jgi:GntR family transcriptional regulator / MocR family aminotransferase
LIDPAKTPLAEQIWEYVRAAIESRVLAPAARPPSWQDLAAQTGVARPSALLIVASGGTGMHVANRPSVAVRHEEAHNAGSLMEMYQELTAQPAVFQMGPPAHETFPAKPFARMRTRAVLAEMSAPPVYPNPRGELELRHEIAAYLALAGGIQCAPSQSIVTCGFSSGLGLALRALGFEKKKVLMEDPGLPFTRHGSAATMSNFHGYDMMPPEARDGWPTHITRVVMDFLTQHEPNWRRGWNRGQVTLGKLEMLFDSTAYQGVTQTLLVRIVRL